MIEKHLKLTLSYDGTAYCGWQVQPNGPSIQAHLEQAIEQVVQHPVKVMGAGRTDAGVHALGQVAHTTLNTSIDLDRLHKGINALLPDDIVVSALEEVGPDFHAIRSAVHKTYRYVVYHHPIAQPLFRAQAWHIGFDLNWQHIEQAGQQLVGTHDFTSFRASGSDVKTSTRTMHRFHVSMAYPNFYFIDLCGDGFLKQMVRNIVGTLIEIGRGKLDTADMQRILEAKDRSRAGPTAPPHGLYLLNVVY